MNLDGDEASSQPTYPRRAVLVGGAAVTTGFVACRSGAGPAASGPQTTAGPTTTVDAPAPPATADPSLRLVRRATYGVRPGLVEEVESLGREAWLDEQLAADPTAHPLESAILEALPVLSMDPADLVARREDAPELAIALITATLVRQSESPFQLHERMVEFWSDHLNAPMTDQLSIPLKLVDHREVARAHALGSFADLLVASAKSTAMLRYLDNATSFRGAINENYARELLELHTVGVDGGYGEDDIVSVARLLTGWTVDRRTIRFQFDAARHDDSPVSVLDWTRPSTGDPQAHGEEFLRHLAVHPATARHLCIKLARRFVADDPPDALVEAMAATWEQESSAIAPVLRTMFEHDAFADAGGKFQRPWDHLVQSLRGLGAGLPVDADAQTLRRLASAVQELGQTPYRWAAPNGYPDVEPAWHDAGAILARWRITSIVVDDALRADGSLRVDELPSAAEVVGESDAADDVVRSVHRMVRGELPTDDQTESLLEVAGWQRGDTVDEAALATASLPILFACLTDPAASYR